jgi:CHAT domain-containing protein
LPSRWDSLPNADAYARALRDLTPPVSPAKRTQPVRDATLAKPAFQYDLTYWERLSEALLPPELKKAIADCDLLCVIPHGPLHALPFAALRWSPTEYLIEHIGLVFAPSATVLRFCQYKNRRRAAGGAVHQPESCFVAAVAAADDPDPAVFERDGVALGDIVRQSGASVRVTSLIGAGSSPDTLPASKELIARLAANHEIVHLACHGIFGPELGSNDPLESGLLVSDGRSVPSLAEVAQLAPHERESFILSARDVFGMDLKADLVMLRACSSGRAQVHSGDELLGLSRAFLYAGTPSLVMTLWNVSQRSSRTLLGEFYRRWLDREAPLPKWAALREAQLGLLRSGDAHPYHWAPYVLAGDWL